jgi:phytoene desaturase
VADGARRRDGKASPAEVLVVGGGIGGLAVAIRLRAAGHHVVVLERNEVPGGKLAVRRRDGFTFDIGPSLVTLPQVFDELFRLAARSSLGR